MVTIQDSVEVGDIPKRIDGQIFWERGWDAVWKIRACVEGVFRVWKVKFGI
jgi:hypothetical protein